MTAVIEAGSKAIYANSKANHENWRLRNGVSCELVEEASTEDKHARVLFECDERPVRVLMSHLLFDAKQLKYHEAS